MEHLEDQEPQDLELWDLMILWLEEHLEWEHLEWEHLE